MRRLLQQFESIFDLDHSIGGEPLRRHVDRVLTRIDAVDLPEFGLAGRSSELASRRGRFVSFYYRPHLFPGMDATLRLAHKLQFHLLPRELPPGAPLSIAAVLESYCHLSGDLFGWTSREDGRFLVWIVDLAGHGVSSGLCSAVLKILFDLRGGDGDAATLTGRINRDLCDCLRSEQCKSQGKCALEGAACVATTERCQELPDCKAQGRCTAQNGECRVVSADDCAQTEPCKSQGRCVPGDNKCLAQGTSCLKSRECKEFAKCTAKDGFCVVASSTDCKQASMCAEHGYCTYRDGKCMLASDEDCAGTEACRVKGQCTFEVNRDASGYLPDAKCVVGSNEDCRQSERCKKHRMCWKRKDKCEK